jgi:hypothetical protein
VNAGLGLSKEGITFISLFPNLPTNPDGKLDDSTGIATLSCLSVKPGSGTTPAKRFAIQSIQIHCELVNLLEMAVVNYSTLNSLSFAGNSAMARLIPPNAEGSSTESDYGVSTIKAGFCAQTEKQHPNHGEQLYHSKC